MTDQEYEYLMDVTDNNAETDCCGAGTIAGFCKDCGDAV